MSCPCSGSRFVHVTPWTEQVSTACYVEALSCNCQCSCKLHLQYWCWALPDLGAVWQVLPHDAAAYLELHKAVLSSSGMPNFRECKEPHHVGCCSLAARAFVGPMRPLQALTASSLPNTMAYRGPLVMNSTNLGKNALPWSRFSRVWPRLIGLHVQGQTDRGIQPHLVLRVKLLRSFLTQLQTCSASKALIVSVQNSSALHNILPADFSGPRAGTR